MDAAELQPGKTPGSNVVPPLPAHELLVADDTCFSEQWRAMTQEAREALPDDVRRQCISRYRKLTPWISASIERAERAVEKLDAWRALKEAKGPRFPRVWLDDATAAIEADYLVKGVIERGRLCLIFGPSGDGKTFFTADLAGHIAVGMPWRERRTKKGLVVYVAAEAGASILRRFYAWREHHMGDAREGHIPLSIITRGINLLNVVDVEALLVHCL